MQTKTITKTGTLRELSKYWNELMKTGHLLMFRRVLKPHQELRPENMKVYEGFFEVIEGEIK